MKDFFADVFPDLHPLKKKGLILLASIGFISDYYIKKYHPRKYILLLCLVYEYHQG